MNEKTSVSIGTFVCMSALGCMRKCRHYCKCECISAYVRDQTCGWSSIKGVVTVQRPSEVVNVSAIMAYLPHKKHS